MAPKLTAHRWIGGDGSLAGSEATVARESKSGKNSQWPQWRRGAARITDDDLCGGGQPTLGLKAIHSCERALSARAVNATGGIVHPAVTTMPTLHDSIPPWARMPADHPRGLCRRRLVASSVATMRGSVVIAARRNSYSHGDPLPVCHRQAAQRMSWFSCQSHGPSASLGAADCGGWRLTWDRGSNASSPNCCVMLLHHGGLCGRGLKVPCRPESAHHRSAMLDVDDYGRLCEFRWRS